MNGKDPAVALEESGTRADASFSQRDPLQAGIPCGQRTWFQIRLIDTKGNPIPNWPYLLTLPDGSTRTGTLDAEGVAGVEGIDPGKCTVEFPGLSPRDLTPVSGSMSIA